MLFRDEFRKLEQIWPVDIDLFASAWNCQLPRFVSWLPQPGAFAVNAFALNWKEFHGYAFPPFSLIPRCLAKVKREQADLVLLCPLWQSQPWFPLLLEMSTDIPRIFHENPFILHSHLLEPHPLLKSSRFQLSAWKLSGNDFKTSVFRLKLFNFSWEALDSRQSPPINPLGNIGWIGALNGIRIPYLLI